MRPYFTHFSIKYSAPNKFHYVANEPVYFAAVVVVIVAHTTKNEFHFVSFAAAQIPQRGSKYN